MLTLRQKISGVAPAVNDFKDKAVVLCADLVLSPGQEVDVAIPPFDYTVVTRLLVAMQGDKDNVESGAGPDLFSLTVLTEDLDTLDLSSWFTPHREALVVPLESAITAYGVVSLMAILRVGNPSAVGGNVRLLVTT